MSGAFARGVHAMNSLFFKPMARKGHHSKCSSTDSLMETIKVEAEEVRNIRGQIGEVEGNCWVPDERTGIYHPKGQEKVMEGIPPAAGKDIGVNWFKHNDHTLV